MEIRPCHADDADALWAMLEPVLRAGETYALPADWTRAEALAFWCGPPHQVYLATDAGVIVGTYYLQPNARGGGVHVANCGYVTAAAASGRGVARAMAEHSFAAAAAEGFAPCSSIASSAPTCGRWRCGSGSALRSLAGYPARSSIQPMALSTRW